MYKRRAGRGARAGGPALPPPLIGALGRARVVAAGMLVSAGGFTGYLVIGLHTSYWAVMVPAMLLSGVGMGMAMTVTADTVLASVPKDRSGSASAIAETATELGAALGMAILGSVLTAVYRNTLDLPGGLPAPAASAARDSLGAALQAAANLPATVAAQVSEAAREAFVDGMHAALVCSAGLAALVAVFALVTLRNVPKVIEEAEEPDLVTAP
ncbi:hypothetical protein [Actinomadura sp. BRA 177]|uniref:hypothetical protein n=1 Tax=Actinomadura sp. BRA 177 TaxID=2745202 RepID=UPI001595065A|nr:hypothetical protein [Actinomadura sp. BRA 177]NVI87221.1 hypothetical protein [Actinomadura sp. BRA 177]